MLIPFLLREEHNQPLVTDRDKDTSRIVAYCLVEVPLRSRPASREGNVLPPRLTLGFPTNTAVLASLLFLLSLLS